MRPRAVSYVTKVVDISEVTMDGILIEGDEDDGYGWVLRERFAKTPRRLLLSEWLERFRGKPVVITIKLQGEQDESHLLPEEEAAQGGSQRKGERR